MSWKDFRDPEFAVVRTPTLPLSTLLSLADGLPPNLTSTEQIVERLLQFWRSGAFRAIVAWAEPVITDLADTWLSDDEPTKRARAARALTAALTRATCRPVPMRAFGSIAFCPIEDSSVDAPLIISAEPARKISVEYLDLLHEVRTIATSEAARDLRQWVTSTTTIELAGTMRYVRSIQTDHDEAFELAQFSTSYYLSDLLRFATKPRSVADLIDKLTDLGADSVAATGLVDSLIAEQVLVTNLLPMAHQANPLSTLQSRLDGQPRLERFANRTRGLQTLVLASEPDQGRVISRTLNKDCSIAGQRPILLTARLSRKLYDGGISRQTLRSAIAAAEVLQFVPTVSDRAELRNFARNFAERYGYADVPLLQVLDPVYGIGFGPRAATLTEIQLRGPRRTAPASDTSVHSAPSTEFDRLLARRLPSGEDHGQSEIVLSRTDLTNMPIQCPLGDSFSLRLRLSRDGGARVLLEGVDSSATRLVGTLGALDNDIARGVERVCGLEASLYPNAVIADIDYLPEAPVSNVLMHPQYRRATIHLHAAPCAEPDCICILPSDLTVRVVGDTVRIYSLSRNVEILPRPSNAHNFVQWGPSIYRFLASLQHQDQQGSLTWNWGTLRYLRYLPRVRFGNCILALQTWRIQQEERVTLRNFTERQLLDWCRHTVARYRIPRCFTYRSASEDKVVDTRNAVSLTMFAREARNAPGDIVIKEVFPAPGRSAVQDESGAQYQHDILVPYTRRQSSRRLPRIANLPQRDVQREFPPGSECLFIKWYGSEALIDTFISTRLQPTMKHLISTDAVQKWFFIRYADPEWHLRLRLFGEPAELFSVALSAVRQVTEEFLSGAECSRLCLDTYVREIERYGGSTAILPAETFFQADSTFVAETLRSVDEAARWKLAVLGADQILRIMVHPQDQGAILANVVSARRAKRPISGAELAHLRQLMESDRSWIREAVRSPGNLTSTDLWNQRQLELLRLKESFDRIESEVGLTTPQREVAWVLVHMYINRILKVSDIDQEAGLCWILDKIYLAREKQDLS